MKKLISVVAASALFAPVALASPPSHYVKVSPKLVTAGNLLHVSGVVAPSCHKGSQVTIYSAAFQGSTKHRWSGVPAVYAKVGSKHKFSTSVRIQGTTQSGSYSVGARCGKATVGHAPLDVTGFY